MYVEFESNKLVNTRYFGRVTKKDETVDNTTTYSLMYELMNGQSLKKTFDNEADRNAAYNALLS